MTQKLIPYGVANYAEFVRDNHYFVDKTYPNAQIRQFVIYCIGNLGFRVFEVE